MERKPTRNFQPATVGKCHLQTATDRFGDEAKGAIRDRERASMGIHPQGIEAPFNWPGLEPDVESPEFDVEQGKPSIYRLIPSMQGYRNNLTALSQTQNLYFVAYQSRIFVYVPRSGPKQTISRHPDLQILSKPSRESFAIGGCVDPATPHTINHLITGRLGQEEIVVACFDDGDVIAYYVKEIAHSVLGERNAPTTAQRSPKRACLDNTPRFFFHENVGHSAWGLAVHSKSRLIAVSSNRFEVTVFAFALADCQNERREALDSCGCRRCLDNTGPVIPGRARNWRVVVALGRRASNIPNICFMDDEDGQAKQVCAVDIKGQMWVADIWNMFQPVIRMGPYAHRLLQSEEFWASPSRGWSVLALANDSFMMVDTVDEMLGPSENLLEIFKPGSRCPQPMINVLPCVKAIPDNPCLPPRTFVLGVRAAMELAATGAAADEPTDESEEQSEDSSEQSEESVEEMEQGFQGAEDPEAIAANQSGAVASVPNSSVTSKDDERSVVESVSSHHSYNGPASQLDMAFFPHNGRVQEIPRRTSELNRFLQRPIEYNQNRWCARNSVDQRSKEIAKRYRFLRTYEKDLELRSLRGENEEGEKEMGVLCPHAVTLGTFEDRNVRAHFRASSRLSMLAHVPELSLVVVGSATGRVALLTPTKLRYPKKTKAGVWDYGLRAEWILPRASDESSCRTIKRPLHGMAIGPVQEGGGDAASRATVPKRFRLMLHYRTHDILTYELTREEQTGKLCIF